MAMELDKSVSGNQFLPAFSCEQASAPDTTRWYAIHTRAKHEKRVAKDLQEKGIQTFVPVVREIHRWSDRKKVVEVPLFPCYAFVHAAMVAEIQTAALHHPSVLRWIGCQGHPSPIPDHELLAITTVVNSGVPVASHAFVKFGERIRIRGGSLDGVQGVLVGNDDDRRLIVSVDILGQSIAVALHNYEFEQAA